MDAKPSGNQKGDVAALTLCIISFALAFVCIFQFIDKKFSFLLLLVLRGLLYLWSIFAALVQLDPLPLIHFIASPYGLLILSSFFMYLGLRFYHIFQQEKK